MIHIYQNCPENIFSVMHLPVSNYPMLFGTKDRHMIVLRNSDGYENVYSKLSGLSDAFNNILFLLILSRSVLWVAPHPHSVPEHISNV